MGHPYRDPPEDTVPRPIVYSLKIDVFLEGRYGRDQGPPKEHVRDRMREELEGWRADIEPCIDKRTMLAIHIDVEEDEDEERRER
jgi:hypothetical protein